MSNEAKVSDERLDEIVVTDGWTSNPQEAVQIARELQQARTDLAAQTERANKAQALLEQTQALHEESAKNLHKAMIDLAEAKAEIERLKGAVR